MSNFRTVLRGWLKGEGLSQSREGCQEPKLKEESHGDSCQLSTRKSFLTLTGGSQVVSILAQVANCWEGQLRVEAVLHQMGLDSTSSCMSCPVSP